MKKLIVLFVQLLICTNTFGQQQGYRYGSSFVELYPDSSSIYFVQTRDVEQMMKLKETVLNDKEGTAIIANLSENSCIVNSKSLSVGNYISDIYRDKEGHKLIILPRFAIKMKSGHAINEVLIKYGNYLSFDQTEINIYKVNCNVDNAEEVLTINKEINSMKSVEWCEPMMIGEAQKFNEYESYQYYINNIGQNGGTPGIDINVVPVWSFLSANTSLIVAVLDDGVQRNHEDLNGAVLDGMTVDYPNEYGDPLNEFSNYYYNGYYYSDSKSHGTACAGIIAAKDNTVGIRGVASGVKILPININPYPQPTNLVYPTLWYEKIGDAITWAYNTKGADVISCSWGFSYNSYISNALTNAMTYGRDGKGTIVVCASGNNLPGLAVAFPANLDNTIAVGAINNNGQIWNYSGRGSTLDLVAPSGACSNSGDVVTTDRSAPKGYNTSDNYTYTFGGTSAACPQVAGVAALMLSANPNLTVSQVRSKLRSTARDLGATGYDTTYGYGLVDAYAAVCSALSGDRIVGPHLVYSYSQYDIENLPSGVTVSWSLLDNHYNTGYNLLVPNYPSVGHCLIVRDPNHDLMTDTLTAEIKYNGITVQTLQKGDIYAYDDFWGQYTSGSVSGEINYTHYFTVKGNTSTTVTSPNFYGATVTYGSNGATPTAWGFNPTNGVLNFKTTPGSTVVINVSSDACGNSYTLYAYAQNSYYLSVSNGEGSITVSLNEEGESSVSGDVIHPWTLEVSNALTGTLMATRSSMSSRSTTISTAGWPKGMYVVRVTIGNEVLTEKVVIK